MNKSVKNTEKEELLEQFAEEKSIFAFNKKLILQCIIAAIFCIAIIFIRLQIYSYSKIYAELASKKSVLLEENKELKRKIEALQFKNKITNYFEVNLEK